MFLLKLYEHIKLNHKLLLIYENHSRHIIIKRIPEDKLSSYTSSQIARQADIFEATMFKHKLNYESYVDRSTLEKRVVHLAKISLAPWKYSLKLKMPKLIVQIDLGDEVKGAPSR